MTHDPLACVGNYDDRDPISLERIRELGNERVFFLSCGDHVFAYDACAWLSHFVETRPCCNPLTRQRVDDRDVWDCFYCALNVYTRLTRGGSEVAGVDMAALERAIDACRSIELKCSVVSQPSGRSKVSIQPVSPLFHVRFKRFGGKESDNATTETKEITYELVDSRDHSVVFGQKRKAKLTHPRRAVVALQV